MRDIFVVAGNHREFHNLIGHAHVQWDYELKNKMVHYVSSALQLEHVHGARVFVYGTYFKRKDWELIEALIQSGGNRKLLIR